MNYLNSMLKRFIKYFDWLKYTNNEIAVGHKTYYFNSRDHDFVLEEIDDCDINTIESGDADLEDYLKNTFIEVDPLDDATEIAVSFAEWLSDNMINYLSGTEKVDFNFLYKEFKNERP